jgi:branched-chain amino acid transport system substrate-binding protein
VSLSGQGGRMRAADHQFQQPLVVGVMDRQGAPGVKFDVEGSGYGFRVIRQISPPNCRAPAGWCARSEIPEHFTPRAGSGSGYEA